MMSANEYRAKAGAAHERAEAITDARLQREYSFLADQWTALAQTADIQDELESWWGTDL